MHLETLLPAIRSLADLPGLVAALGHQPLWEQLPPGTRKGAGRAAPGITVVGRTAEMPWFGVLEDGAERNGEKLARRMSASGRVCLVLALQPAAHRLTVTLGLNDCPSLQIDLVDPKRATLASLERLSGNRQPGALSFAARAADALNAESVGARFFHEFRTTLEKLSAGVPGTMHAEDRRSLALLQLTRVLFLYFIQTKGWLGGRERFIAEEVDRCLVQRRRIHRDLLRPLFFGTLNRPAQVRSRAASAFGQIPFLNGGLFEPHALERRFQADIPNDLWRDAFDHLFERFHFTVSEGEVHGGVAPDMLGRVFEGVMAPADRHASGTFYTPASLVGQVLDAAIVAWLARRLHCSDTEAERRFKDPDPRTSVVLATVTLLDPAVGSGAFLLGALERLSVAAKGADLAARKRRILQQNLFGVDQSAAAVRLTELRLWLAVIADDRAVQAGDVKPLPNLDCLVRQGDSLFDPIHQGAETSVHNPEFVRELSALRQDLIAACGADKRCLIRRLRKAEGQALSECLRAAEESNRRSVGDCLSQARATDLFGTPRGVDRDLRQRIQELRSRGRTLSSARRQVSRTGEVPWFHYQSHFADVFAGGGFDLVVGNPPWLRAEKIPRSVRSRLSGRYRWWRTPGGIYGNKSDLSVAFLERSFELAARGGVVAMLVPAKIATAGYASATRHAMASTTTMNAVVDLTRVAGAEFDATVYPMALVATNATAPAQHRVRTSLGVRKGRGVLQSGLTGGSPWILVEDRVRGVLAVLAAAHPTLDEKFRCQLGVKTGANGVFLNPPSQVEPEVLRWAVRGRDVAPFHCAPRARLLWTHGQDGRPRPDLPPECTAYLTDHQLQLRNRADYTGGPPWTLFRVRPALSRYRVVWADLARRLAAAALTTQRDLESIPLNSCYVVAAQNAATAECLAACLNSTWLRAVASVIAVPAAGGFFRFNALAVAKLPLPSSALNDSELSRLARAGRAGDQVQSQLDEHMARHLGLSPASQHALRTVVDSASGHRS
jgi:hypothetical protein